MEITQKVIGMTDAGQAVVSYTLVSASGVEVDLMNLGATILAVRMPDRNGKVADVALGYPDWKSYINDGPYFGKTVGRFANRINKGRFTLDGKDYKLDVNNGPNHLHGGFDNFSSRIWDARVETDRVVFSLVSPAGDQGYPSELGVEVDYFLSDKGDLEITYWARTDGVTIVNLTNHNYFNLAGESSGSVYDQLLKLHATKWLEKDNTGIPTGNLLPVAGTPMDFTAPTRIGKGIKEDFGTMYGDKGYDHCWAIDAYKKGEMHVAAELSDPASGRKLIVSTTYPGVQAYTGNWLEGSAEGKGGRGYNNHDGIALECQLFPDTPNHPGFPTARLEKGETYNEKITFSFRTE